MKEFEQYLDRGRFNTLAQARHLSGEIANTAKRSPLASAWAKQIKRLEDYACRETFGTLSKARFSIFTTLVELGVPAQELLKRGWERGLNIQTALLSKPSKLEPGECEAFLVSKSALQSPPADPLSTRVAAQLKEHEAASARHKAESKARFEENWGDGRIARENAALDAYLATAPGSKEREEFFAKNEAVIWRAARRIMNAPYPASS